MAALLLVLVVVILTALLTLLVSYAKAVSLGTSVNTDHQVMTSSPSDMTIPKSSKVGNNYNKT
jgi:hypothetical protein